MMNGRIQNTAVALLCLFVLSSCGGKQDYEEVLSSVESLETYSEESDFQISVERDEDISVEDPSAESSEPSEALPEIPTEENGIMEIYAARDVISVSEDIMIAQVSPQEILRGNPILYDRFRIDGWFFEWWISDYYDDDDRFLEDGVLVVSHEDEDEKEDAQVIHVTAKGGNATGVSVKNKFEYVDVNFDDIPDLLICTGHHGNEGLLTYYCFLQTGNGFEEAPTFTDIANPAIDAEHGLILSQWRNTAMSHSWAEYKCQDNTYIMYRELCEDVISDSPDEEIIWIWTVNDEEIGRSDVLSMEEIEDLLYNENSEWGIAGDRWRTIYNNGLIVDYSIYEEP